MSEIDRGPESPADRESTPTGLYLQQPQIAASNKPHWPSGTPTMVGAPSKDKMWQQQQQDVKHRQYLKQQQRLKAMGVPNNKNVSADSLIGNLLEKKDTFRPKQPVHIPAAPLPVPGIPSPSPVQRVPSEQMAVSDDLPPWIWPGSARLPPIYAHIWTLVADPASGGTLVDTNRIFPLLLTSGLSTQVLGFIWNLAAQGVPSHIEHIPGGSGQLTAQQLYVVLALVALAQTGCTFNSLSILKMLPQPPIPTFNMGTKSPSADGTNIQANAAPLLTQAPSQVPTQVPTQVLTQVSTQVPTQVHVSAVAPYQMPDANVATIPSSSVPVTLSIQPSSVRQEDLFFTSDSKEDDFSEFQSADIPSATVVQPSSAAKQVVSELNHSVIARFGNQGRSIGSRLANHTLGAPKPAKNHHHKHHRSERRASMDTPYFDDEVTFGGGRTRKLSSDNSHAAKVEEAYMQHQQGGDSSENDDFNDFQMAIGLNVNVHELFPKCKQIKRRTMVLKESAIRNEPNEKAERQPEVDILSLDTPAPEPTADLFQCAEPARTEAPKVPPPIQPPPQSTLSQIVPRPVIQPQPSIQTDTPPPTQPPGAKELMTVQEDKYSALRFLELEPEAEPTATSSSDDFGDFVSAEDSFGEMMSEPRLAPFATSAPEIAAEDSFLRIVERNTDTEKSLFVDSEPTKVETKIEEFPVDDWLSFESNRAPSESMRPALEDLNSIFSTLSFNSEVNSLRPQVEVARNEDSDDDFGDFVGPGDDTSGKLDAVAHSDSRSVSSFEFASTSLSRQGSLPSIDLKILPLADDPLERFKEGCALVDEWKRCLDCCASLLQAAVNTFTSISSQDVVMEVLGTTEGRAYFINLKEVRSVCNRIHYSYNRCGQELNQIDSSLKTAQQAWDRLDRFYKLANIDTVDCEIREDSGVATPCFICCCPTTLEALDYNGHTYHSSCANLWLNCVTNI